MHNASVGVYLKILGSLDTMLEKAEKWTADRKIDPNAILQARLAPDMFAFTRQVQIATDMAKGTVESSFAELKARVAKTIAFLQSLPADAFTGSETRAITLKLGPPGNQREMNFQGLDYLQGFGTPNVYFHFSMVYALLRHNGLEIGKRDYTG
jgi:hypothetical protein